MKDSIDNLNMEKEFKKEKIVITQIGTGCSFPGCNNISEYKLKLLGEVVYLCRGHKNYIKNKLSVELIVVDSRTFNKVPPVIRYFLENDKQKHYLKSRSLASPITSFNRAWRKPKKKEREGILLGHFLYKLNIKSQEIIQGNKITVVEPWEQKTYTQVCLEQKERKENEKNKKNCKQ